MKLTELPVQHLLTITFRTASTVSDHGAAGTRVLVNVSGGEFSGKGLQGTVIAGSDWVFKRPGGTLALDVRAELRTDDGITVLMTYQGLSVQPADGPARLSTTPRFEAPPDSRYAWLNDEVCVAHGKVGTGSVEYEVYGIR